MGSGTLTLKGTNLFTGTFTLQGGTVVAGNTQALGVGVLDVTGASALAMSYRSPLAVTVGTLGAVLTLSVDGTGAQVPGTYKLLHAAVPLDSEKIALDATGISPGTRKKLKVESDGVYLVLSAAGTVIKIQ